MGKVKLNWQQEEAVNELESYLNVNDNTFFGLYGGGGYAKIGKTIRTTQTLLRNRRGALQKPKFSRRTE